MRLLLTFMIAVGLGVAPAYAQVGSDPVSLITAIYKTYETNEPGLPHIYSERLQTLIDKDEKETPEGMAGRIDWDVFVDGQDWQLSALKVALISQSATHAQVNATFENFGRASDMLFELVFENGHWRVDDVAERLKPRWTMSKILMDAPDAFPNAEPDNSSDVR